MITKDRVSFKIAKLLKDKGFNCECTHCYNTNGELLSIFKDVYVYGTPISPENWNNLSEKQLGIIGLAGWYGYTSAPSLAAVIEWFREKCGWIINIEYQVESATFKWRIYNYNPEKYTNFQHYENYTKCVKDPIEYCLKYLI